MNPVKRNKAVPTYVVVIAVVVAAGVTTFAMLKAGYAAPWETNQAYSLTAAPQVWGAWAGTPAPLPGVGATFPVGGTVAPAAPPPCAIPQFGGAPPAAGPSPFGGAPMTGAPMPGPVAPTAPPSVTIGRADAIPAHGDRGLCASCHNVVDARGAPLPTIRSFSPLFHQYRGVCGNCHRIASGPGGTGTATLPATGTAANPAATTPTPTEGEWLGLELSPINQLTATQFSLAPGSQGLVLVEAEGQAAAKGLKPGDVLIAVNGIPVRSMTDFFQATNNGTLASGVVELLRGDQRVSVTMSGPTTTPAGAARPAGAPSLLVNPIDVLPQRNGMVGPSPF